MTTTKNVVVGTAKSLINSIKEKRGEKTGKAKQKPPVSQGDSAIAMETEDHGVENDDLEDFDKNDGVDISVSGSDNFTDPEDEGPPSSTESETESSASEHENRRSKSRSEGYKQNRQAASKHKRDVTDSESEYSDQQESGSPGSESSDELELSQLRRDPKVKRLFKLIEKDEKKRRERKKRKERRSSKRGKGALQSAEKVGSTPHRGTNQKRGNLIKSLSDTTLYAPAVQRRTVLTVATGGVGVPQDLVRNVNAEEVMPGRHIREQNINQTIDQISDIVGQMQVRGRRDRSADRRSSSSQQREPEEDPDEAKRAAERMIIDAEKFRVSVSAPPPGEPMFVNEERLENQVDKSNIDQVLQFIYDNHDEDFYQITSHVDLHLKQQIQKGEFVELEALVPKARGQLVKDDDRLQQYVTKGGYTY